MLIKVIAIIAFIGACRASEHAYSSQSITRYESHHDHHDDHYEHEEHQQEHHGHDDHKHREHKAEQKVEHQTHIAHPVSHHAVVGHGHNTQHHEHIENKPHHDKLLSEHKVEHHEHNAERKTEHKVEHKVDHKVEQKVEPKKEEKAEPKKEHKEEPKKEQKEEPKKEQKVKASTDKHEKKAEEHKDEKEEHVEHKPSELHTKVAPVVEKHDTSAVPAPSKADPVVQYVHKNSEGHQHHEPATSYQHISRHDVPAPPPKDFTDYSGTSKYEFAYEVKDPHTGDHKYQHESHDGRTVKGVYSLHQADGSVRTVQYAADKHGGFSADVKQSTKHVEEKHHR